MGKAIQMNRFGTFARNRQNGFVGLTNCFVIAGRDDTFPAASRRVVARLSAGVSAVSCLLAVRQWVPDDAALAGPAGRALPVAAGRARQAGAVRPVAAGAAVRPAVAGAADSPAVGRLRPVRADRRALCLGRRAGRQSTRPRCACRWRALRRRTRRRADLSRCAGRSLTLPARLTRTLADPAAASRVVSLVASLAGRALRPAAVAADPDGFAARLAPAVAGRAGADRAGRSAGSARRVAARAGGSAGSD